MTALLVDPRGRGMTRFPRAIQVFRARKGIDERVTLVSLRDGVAGLRS